MLKAICDRCTDHMITCTWTASSGWQSPRLVPYGPFSIMPTASVLHYATECFEGLKFYRGYDGALRLFRPDRNCNRMLRSATRISLPAFDPQELQKLIKALVSVDGERWLPKSRPGNFLYLRPTMIATAPGLGVKVPQEALLYVIACCLPTLDEPQRNPFVEMDQSINTTGTDSVKTSRHGMKLFASRHNMVRAWPGGFGFAKVGANYGPSLLAQAEAKSLGYDQVLWLLGPDCEITEAGASNFFVVWRTRQGQLQLVTAPLDDQVILDGVTRRSVLELARERLGDTREIPEAVDVVERKFYMDEVVEAGKEGRLVEAFVVGTAVG